MSVGGWRPARIVQVRDETKSARVLRIDVLGWPGSEAGQHVDIRLTAEDGYQAVRSYSLASSGGSSILELGVDEVPDGEVSPYLVRDAQVGDELEVKGPLGRFFIWRPQNTEPVQLIAGGSGIVPLMSMFRAARDAGRSDTARLLYSVRTPDDAIYRDELLDVGSDSAVQWAYTRSAPSGWTGRLGRIDAELLRTVVWPSEQGPTVFVCGPTGFVEHVSDLLVDLGHTPARIRTERFGGR